jgi:hypothetical protein
MEVLVVCGQGGSAGGAGGSTWVAHIRGVGAALGPGRGGGNAQLALVH